MADSELLLQILRSIKCDTYLELGVNNKNLFIKMTEIIKRVIGVNTKDFRDGNVGEFYECSNDEFFEKFKEKVDVIFINRIDRFEDFENSIKILNKNGLIIINNTDPVCKELLETTGLESYKIINYVYNNHKELEIITLPIMDNGLSLIKKKEERRLLEFKPEDLFGFNIKNEDVTLLVTCCDRSDLLKRTLDSFNKYNTYPIHHVIIVEDSCKKGINDFVLNMFNCPVTLIYNEKRIKQMKSIEKAASFITTPYVFHCEEDWEFYDSGFIEESLKILRKDPKVTCIFMRSHEEYLMRYSVNLATVDKGDYYYVSTDNKGGLSFNPGLRRTDIEKFRMPYKDGEDEGTLSKYYRNIDMVGASIKKPSGYVRHLGWDRHVW